MKFKKAQYYIFTAIVLVIFLSGIILYPKIEKDEKDSFNMLAENFEKEAPKAINYALFNNSNATLLFADFATGFYNYAKSVDNNFQIIYVVHEKNSVFIGNLADENTSVIANPNVTLGKGLNVTLPRSNNSNGIALRIIQNDYTLNFTGTGFRALLFSKGKETIKVAVK